MKNIVSSKFLWFPKSAFRCLVHHYWHWMWNWQYIFCCDDWLCRQNFKAVTHNSGVVLLSLIYIFIMLNIPSLQQVIVSFFLCCLSLFFYMTWCSCSLHLTTFCLQYKPTVISCVCIHLACKWSNWEIPVSTDGKHWWEYVDSSVTLELLDGMWYDFIINGFSFHVWALCLKSSSAAQESSLYTCVVELTNEFLQILEKTPSRLKRIRNWRVGVLWWNNTIVKSHPFSVLVHFKLFLFLFQGYTSC